jgi:hypothetical protein
MQSRTPVDRPSALRTSKGGTMANGHHGFPEWMTCACPACGLPAEIMHPHTVAASGGPPCTIVTIACAADNKHRYRWSIEDLHAVA